VRVLEDVIAHNGEGRREGVKKEKGRTISMNPLSNYQIRLFIFNHL
jgi:hypothetical protein